VARHAEERDLDDYRMSINYLTAQADWSEHFFGHKIDRSMIAEIQALIGEHGARGSTRAAVLTEATRSLFRHWWGYSSPGMRS
jgi:hypothetical protein